MVASLGLILPSAGTSTILASSSLSDSNEKILVSQLSHCYEIIRFASPRYPSFVLGAWGGGFYVHEPSDILRFSHRLSTVECLHEPPLLESAPYDKYKRYTDDQIITSDRVEWGWAGIWTYQQ